MNVRLARLNAAAEDRLWYKDAIIYQLHVKSFFDSNNDGIGDFPGLVSKLDYIANLGATAIWLLPFYPSPRLDDGYDISEYRAVHPDYGTMADLRRFIAPPRAKPAWPVLARLGRAPLRLVAPLAVIGLLGWAALPSLRIETGTSTR